MWEVIEADPWTDDVRYRIREVNPVMSGTHTEEETAYHKGLVPANPLLTLAILSREGKYPQVPWWTEESDHAEDV